MSRYASGARGEFADHPRRIPAKGWWAVLKRVRLEVMEDDVSILSAGVAFYGFLAVFPVLAAFVMIYGLVVSPDEIQEKVALLQRFAPAAAYGIIESQVGDVVRSSEGKLSLGILFSLLLALWSSTKGTRALIKALNVAYEQEEGRNIVMLAIMSYVLTAGAVIFVVAALFTITAVGPILEFVSFGVLPQTAIRWLRWLVIFALLAMGLSLVYRWAPNRRGAKPRWLMPGALVAAVLWVVASMAFSFYVENFGNYNETFGALGAVVVLLMWFYIGAFVICLGAELNAELERHTYRDSTTGRDRPIGRRGAAVADQPPPGG